MTNKERFDAGEFTIDLLRASDDPSEGEPAFQEELSRFCAALQAAGVAAKWARLLD